MNHLDNQVYSMLIFSIILAPLIVLVLIVVVFMRGTIGTIIEIQDILDGTTTETINNTSSGNDSAILFQSLS